MDSKIKKLVAGIALVGAASVGTAGAAVAVEGAGPTGDASAQTARRHPALRHAIRRAVVKVVTDTLGVTRQELREALRSGQTLTEYATSLGKDPQTLVDALISAANSKLDEWVADGKITQARGDIIKSKLPERINRLMNHQFGQHAAV